jgi:4'-phosphopantetheinyl transferase
MGLSHTGGFAVCAVSHAGRVGVDVESIRRRVPLRILESCFAPAERRALGATAEPDRAGSFFELWTLKEALLKATGRGLTYPLNRLSFEIGGGAPCLQIPEDLPEAAGAWRFETWLVDQEFRISLALENGGSVCPITLEQASLCPSTPIF